MPESERLALKIKLVTRYINNIKPVKSSCVVCVGEDPLTWNDARVDITRRQVHCAIHCFDFHQSELVPPGKGCVSCDPYDAALCPLDRYELQRIDGGNNVGIHLSSNVFAILKKTDSVPRNIEMLTSVPHSIEMLEASVERARKDVKEADEGVRAVLNAKIAMCKSLEKAKQKAIALHK